MAGRLSDRVGILSMNRMVDGTFGVAVLGAMVSTLGRSKIDQLLPHAPGAERAGMVASLGSVGVHGLPSGIIAATNNAFVYSLQWGLRLGSAVALVGALAAWLLIGRDRRLAPVRASGAGEQPVETPQRSNGEPMQPDMPPAETVGV